jgi:hypothetical protein
MGMGSRRRPRINDETSRSTWSNAKCVAIAIGVCAVGICLVLFGRQLREKHGNDDTHVAKIP